MCGILGVFGADIGIVHEQFERAAQTLTHRGPDGKGFFYTPHCYLGHRRLSIIDLSGGGQPMTSSCGRYTIVFNGEIYNYRTLRRVLEGQYRFVTQSDTEVILAAYIVYGGKLVDHIEGMYAFALYDTQRQELFVARDPLGVKPLVYGVVGGVFICASEIQTVEALCVSPPVISRQAIVDYMHLKHIPAPHTIYEHIHKLPAGHRMMVSLQQDTVVYTIEQFWKPEYAPRKIIHPQEVFRTAFIDAVEKHLVADVPVGVFLSGGIDSSAIVWAMSKIGVPIHTFTVGFADDPTDPDIACARLVAKTFQTDHHELIISRDEYCATARRIAVAFGEPFADPASASSESVAGAVAGHIKVILSGDGGDELFFGYAAYERLRWLDRSGVSGVASGWWRKHALSWYFQSHTSVLARLWKHSCASSFLANGPSSSATVTQRMYDLSHTLPDYYLRKADITSMAHSIEVRVPFCYRPLVDDMLAIPVDVHMHHGKGKSLLRSALRTELPSAILTRPKKGFSRPTHIFFEDPKQIEYIEDMLNPTGLFHTDELHNILTNTRYRSLWWRLLVLAWWFESHPYRIS